MKIEKEPANWMKNKIAKQINQDIPILQTCIVLWQYRDKPSKMFLIVPLGLLHIDFSPNSFTLPSSAKKNIGKI